MHERLLESLLRIADVRLVACYTNDQLGFASDKRIQVFIPDLHLLSAARRALYTYGTNCEEMLVDVVHALIELKTGASPDENVTVFHIGDYLDLWRESLTPGGDADVPDRIKRDHETLAGLLEDDRLNAHFLLGNHDFELYQLSVYNRWERRFFIPGSAPSVMVLHGDYFDWVEREVPEDIRDVAVYLFGQSHEAGSPVVGKMADLARKYNSERDYSQQLQLAKPATLGTAQAGAAAVPREYNVQRTNQTVDGGLQFLDTACQECINANREFGTNLKTVIIGHTHHARIAVQQMPDGSPFALIDTGAWIENCVENIGGPASPNAQITALSANQVRIYQLQAKN
jgi:UDP-2,3-diacylglucosamine pyrophosphatase LpxH